MVEDDDVNLEPLHQSRNLVHLARANQVRRIRPLPHLHLAVDNVRPRALRQRLQLRQRILRRQGGPFPATPVHSHQQRPFRPSLCGDGCVLALGQLAFGAIAVMRHHRLALSRQRRRPGHAMNGSRLPYAMSMRRPGYHYR